MSTITTAEARTTLGLLETTGDRARLAYTAQVVGVEVVKKTDPISPAEAVAILDTMDSLGAEFSSLSVLRVD